MAETKKKKMIAFAATHQKAARCLLAAAAAGSFAAHLRPSRPEVSQQRTRNLARAPECVWRHLGEPIGPELDTWR